MVPPLTTCRPKLVKETLRDIGRMLLEEDWEFTVTKEGKEVVTAFQPAKEDNG